MPASPDTHPRARIMVVGSGWRFLSGISYYTCRLANALHSRHDVAAILMRRLLPQRLYPGRTRVGQRLSDLRYAEGVPVFDGVDWWGVPSLVRAVRFLRKFRPDVLVLQWWTGTVLHSYLVLCLAARLAGTRIVIEFHEVQDTGEARHRWAARYTRALIKPLLRRTDGVVVHSRFDQEALSETYALGARPVEIALHGPFDHHSVPAARVPAQPGGPCRLLFFGTIRPYKGLEDLIEAFALLPANYHLTVVGETWEGWTRPASLIAESSAAGRITFVNRYVADAEVDGFFAAADVVVLPYRRSSASGPLHIAMSHGLPVVVTAVGGLVEAASPYSGTVFVPAVSAAACSADDGRAACSAYGGRAAALASAIREASALVGRRHADPSSWEQTVAAYDRLLVRLGVLPQEEATVTSSNQTVPRFSPDLR